MQIHQIKRIHPNTKRMIVARGGKRGKTAGRGGKGQSARAGNKRRPEWRDIIKKLPKLRGRGVNQNKPVSEKSIAINLSVLENVFQAKDSVTPSILIEKGIIALASGVIPPVKILGEGEITKPLNISGCSFSASVKEKVEKVGGSVTPLPSRVIKKSTEKKPSNKTEKKEEKAPVAEKKVEKKEKKSKSPSSSKK